VVPVSCEVLASVLPPVCVGEICVRPDSVPGEDEGVLDPEVPLGPAASMS
jgi:hypothetical protein